MNRKNTISRPRRTSANGRPDPLWTIARLRRHFGMIPAERFLLHPRPGMATEDDLIYVNAHDRLCELVDGVLVEKAMGAREAMMAGILLQWFWNFLDKHDLGIVLGAD